jgi:hypothetical protein
MVHLTARNREHWIETEIFWPKFSKIEKSYPLKYIWIKRFLFLDLFELT